MIIILPIISFIWYLYDEKPLDLDKLVNEE